VGNFLEYIPEEESDESDEMIDGDVKYKSSVENDITSDDGLRSYVASIVKDLGNIETEMFEVLKIENETKDTSGNVKILKENCDNPRSKENPAYSPTLLNLEFENERDSKIQHSDGKTFPINNDAKTGENLLLEMENFLQSGGKMWSEPSRPTAAASTLTEMTEDTGKIIAQVKSDLQAQPFRSLKEAHQDFSEKAESAMKATQILKYASDEESIRSAKMNMASTAFAAMKAAKLVKELEKPMESLRDKEKLMMEKVKCTRRAIKEEINTIDAELRELHDDNRNRDWTSKRVTNQLKESASAPEENINDMCGVLDKLLLQREELQLPENYDHEYRRIVHMLGSLFDRAVSNV